MAAMVCDLHIGDEMVEGLTVLGLPEHFLVQELAAALSKQLDDSFPVVEIAPEPLCVEELQLLFFVNPRVRAGANCGRGAAPPRQRRSMRAGQYSSISRN